MAAEGGTRSTSFDLRSRPRETPAQGHAEVDAPLLHFVARSMSLRRRFAAGVAEDDLEW
jgi:hypothetical protein